MTNGRTQGRPRPARLLTTTALGTILVLCAAVIDPARADSGLSCVMQDGSCVIDTDGIDGIDGPDGTSDAKNGSWGQEGSAGGVNTSNFDNVTGLLSSGTATSPVNITAIGGKGGDGGNGYPSTTEQNFGGNGANGMDGGTINATIGPNTSGLATAGTTGLAISGVTILSQGGAGGGGGVASYEEGSQGNGTSGTGGDGQSVQATVGGQWQSAIGNGVYIASLGGNGGTGRSGGGKLADGANGGQGGSSNLVTATITGEIYGAAAGVNVTSAGGNGGNGGDGGGLDGDGAGKGGNGGQAGDVTATLASGAKITMGEDTTGQGLVVGSYGGAGGAGGSASGAAGAGAGGNAGNAAANVYGSVLSYNFNDSYGVLVQSIGGIGGNGGRSGAWFNPQGGNGNLGGTAGTATITGTNANIQTGVQVDFGDANAQNETAVIAQSIGGGGGVGGSVQDGWFAVGGSGGDGSSGNTASAKLTDSTVITNTFLSSGIVAQSIGGGGGKGGDATKSDGAIVNMVVGGNGGAGGGAGDAFAGNLGNGTVTTFGDHSVGIVMQSIGGGGGSGGAGYGESASAFYGAAISVGGNGGSGGDGGTANAAQGDNNSGAILTSGAESYGILAQSVGGGGGSGGASTAKSKVFAKGDFPAFSLSLSTGGTGGDGGKASDVYLHSTGFIATTGNGAAGMIGQAIGGGGGTGGDANGASSASGGSFDFAATVSHGGNGGGAGDGAVATGINDGLIITRGESADGMLIQSIGGGGGAGGAGDALATTGEQKSLSTTLSLGGKSAGGGEGYDVFATNNGAILTLGDGAHGIVAQTIGGGGGRGGGAAASNSGTIGLNVAVGAKGGNGGDTYYNGSSSGVTNTGTILTYGADAGGILAQSIGGGGGAGGKAGTSLGSSTSNDDGSNGSDESVTDELEKIALTGYNDYQDLTSTYNNIETLTLTAGSLLGKEISDGDVVQNLDNTASSGGSIDYSNVSTSNTLILALGGTGGAGGAGGDMSVTNTGTVATMGNMSDAVVVQSIGGGGGKGGAASTSSSESWSSPGFSSGVGVGGGTQGSSSNPNATSGAQAVIHNYGNVYTTGAIAGGLIAQSIGMGGGVGGSTSVTNADSEGNLVLAFPVSVGGTSEAANGISEQATVTSSGAIQTLGHDSYGIIAQSISGGGGIVKTLAANLDFAGGSTNTASWKNFTGDISLGSDHGVISGYSGAATVTTTQGGTIITSGDNAVGILAQSIAGGGGLALGGVPTGSSALEFLGSGGKTGGVNPGLDPEKQNSGVVVEVGDDITTSGQGAVGVFAQSVGGGGGVLGNLGWSQSFKLMDPNHSSFVGNGGDVQVTVDAGATITTTGWASAGIIAQSVGGGGGWIGTQSAAFIGSAGGTGLGYPVNVTVNGAVDAQGPFSPGILAQSTGGADNGGIGSGDRISVTVGGPANSAASVWGGEGGGDVAAAVYFANGGTANSPNQLINYGTIATHDNQTGTAVFGDGLYFEGTNWGSITGNLHLAHGDITNEGSGSLHPYSEIDLGGGELVNKGVLDLTAGPSETTLSGSYAGIASSSIQLGADFLQGTSDHLTVTGDATVNSRLRFSSTTLVPSPVMVMTVEGTLTLAEDLGAERVGPVFSFSPTIAGKSLVVTPRADFTTSGLNQDQASLAGHLQRVWDGENPGALAHGFAALSDLADDPSYVAALESLIDRQVGAIATARVDSSRAFVANMNSCPVFVGDGLLMQETNCGWIRGIGGRLDATGNAGSGGFNADATTAQLGGQYEAWDNVFVAASLAYESSTLTTDDGLSSADGSVWMGGLGLKYQSGPLLASAMLDAGSGSFDSSRRIIVGDDVFTANSAPDVANAGLHGRISYQLPYQGFYLRPSLDLDASHVDLGGYTETGGGEFNLAVEGTDGWVFAATPALEVGTRIDAGNGTVLRPYLGIGATLTNGNDWAVESRFAGADASAGSFTSTIDNPDTLGLIRAGVEVMSSKNFSATLLYNGAFADGYSANAGAVKLTWRF
ncbi:autotransporter outer membrane beta-barrel domain-containing protein [Neotabrizicola shimadae]|uniref:Autotransporter outer membrane beta-barrel domain-containing protein n=1 Tax=Neotabrizicola shimadae TaxID=2807096 RepID=A0A8G1EBU8_9RHOB|nr:autotransporter outer membrane beta-barrel domain-containing protein [Neotabrizicola shimadae]QYZ70000.1 autotransporter outer membrane beta-barrel domain-containing protein [Neotabrizicola shimadae]